MSHDLTYEALVHHLTGHKPRKLALTARAESPTPEGQGSATHPVNTVNNGLQLTGTGLQIARSLRDRAANPRRQLNPNVVWPPQSGLVGSRPACGP